MASPINLDKAPPRAAVRAGMALRRRLRRMSDWLVPPEVLAYELAISFFATRIAGALTDLGVIDALGEDKRTAADLAEELDLDADTLHRTLRLAAAQGLAELDRHGRFSLTPVGLTIRREATPTLGPWISHVNTEAVQRPWANLPGTIRTGEPTFPRIYGKSVWQHFAENPNEERLFAESMRELTALALGWIVQRYPVAESGVIADGAGGWGPVLAGILQARPGLNGILVEAPGVLAEADLHLQRAGVRGRVDLVEGNIFERVEAKADIYLMKDIVHDWDDERSLQIIRTVAAAMEPGSKLVLIEQLLERNDPEPIVASVDMHMLNVCDGGRQRSAAELQELLRTAGLRTGDVHEAGLTGLVEGLK
jgi:hypothetical protein